MSERTLASLDAAVTELETWKEYLSGNISKIQADEADYKSELNTFYLMWAGTPLPRLCIRDGTESRAESTLPPFTGALIFLMQAGFATLSAGSIRAKNVKNILLKNLLDACIGAFAWYLLGYGFAYDVDDNTNPFIGAGPSHFALSGHKDWDGSENKGCAPVALARARFLRRLRHSPRPALHALGIALQTTGYRGTSSTPSARRRQLSCRAPWPSAASLWRTSSTRSASRASSIRSWCTGCGMARASSPPSTRTT